MKTFAARSQRPTTAEAPASREAAPSRAAGSVGGASLARAERLGHRLEALAPIPAATAPIQRVRWRWNASSSSWSAIGPSGPTSTPPTHIGSADGEEHEDNIYSQATDPTVRPFLTGGRGYMGERGAHLQAKGKKPSAADIRESAVKTPELRGGSGLHELLPTNMGPEVATSGNPIAIGLQSGARTSTAHQMFRIGGDVGAHTGFAPKPTGSGSTHTRGQAPAHDRMRKRARSSVFSETDPDKAVNELMHEHLDVTPTGLDVLSSPYIEGMQPNISSIGKIGPVGTKDPGRTRLAQFVHEGRENVKKRARAHKRATGRGRSPSPERMPIDDDGTGGGYLMGPSLPLPPVPTFEGTPGSWQHVANTASWVTAPQRVGYKHSPPSLPISTTPTTPTPTTPTPTTPSILPPPPPLPPPPLSSPTPISTPAPTPMPISPPPPILPPPPPLPPPPLHSAPTPISAPTPMHLPPPPPLPPPPMSAPFAPLLPSPSPFTFSAPPSASNSAPSRRYPLRKRKPRERR